MSNVLPQRSRTQVMREMRMRFLLVGSLVCSAVAFVAALALMPAYFSAALPRMSLQAPQTDTAQRAQEESDREVAARTRSLLAALMPFTEERPAVHALMEKAFALRPTGITLERVTYQAGEEGEMVLTGVALSREHVNAYREALANEAVFEQVSVPVAALVGASEGNFTMTLKGKF